MFLTITDLKKTKASSDHHFWHNNVLKYCSRPFSSIEEMNEILIKNWNEVVDPDDTVIYIGDFSMAFRAVETITKRLNGRKILFCGNHDFCHPAHKKSRTPENQEAWKQKYLDNGWAEVHIAGEIDIPGVATVNVNHLPYINPKVPLRHDKFRPKDDTRWLLCGHVHQNWDQRKKMINVGVDVRGFKPMDFEEIAKIILAKPEGYQDFGPEEAHEKKRTDEEY